MNVEVNIETQRKTNYLQNIVFNLIKKIKYGRISIIDANSRHDFFADNNNCNLHACITVQNKKFYREILFGGSNGAAESYINKHWDVDNLVALIEIMVKNKSIFNDFDAGFSTLINSITKLSCYLHKNNRAQAKKNIVAHYDLGNEFFECFLDKTMQYSSAIYTQEANTLHKASLNKLKTICELLQLKPSDHLLEIGTGWGGLAIYAAQEYGCRVTTTTISEKQYHYVQNKITTLGLSGTITLLKKDYRDLTGLYDKVVSIEMIEAVGHRYFDVYFNKCNQLLKNEGLLLLQAITINDKSYDQARNSVDFIKKYIFPGGCLPSVEAIYKSVAKNADFQLMHLNDIGKHYVSTLLDWLASFEQNIDLIKSHGYSDRFIRMWKYYLCYCAAGFNQAYISNVHLLWKNRE